MYTLVIWTTVVFLGVNCKIPSEDFYHNPYEEAVRHSPLMRQRVQGYLQVRPGVHLFYQLLYANGTKVGAPSKPLLIWVQGGPGYAASGIGTFGEIGPLDMNFKPRNHTWVKKGNVLLIDHPVGAGFSYATSESLYAKNDRDMATDLAKAIRMFLKRRKEFRKTPTYIIGQSYGGKICPRLALYLSKAIQNKRLVMNFKGIGIGGGWVNPRESVIMEPEMLYQNGHIDLELYLKAKKLSIKLAQAVDKQNYDEASSLDRELFLTLQGQELINFNNYNKLFEDFTELDYKMNSFVKPTFRNVNQTREWRYICEEAYSNLKESMMVPSYSFLELLLNESNLKVIVYNGNLDVVTPIAGASNWVHKLNWHGTANFLKASRQPIRGEKRNGFYKAWGKLSFWTVIGAGHWVPEDNPEAMDHILDYMISESPWIPKGFDLNNVIMLSGKNWTYQKDSHKSIQ